MDIVFAIFSALTAILSKIGISAVNSNPATAIRTTIVQNYIIPKGRYVYEV